jgi:hypothetical protein
VALSRISARTKFITILLLALGVCELNPNGHVMSNYDDIKAESYEANLLLPEFKLIDLTFGNVSVADSERQVFAVKPSGVDYSAMKVGDMVVVDFEGNIIEGESLLGMTNSAKLSWALFASPSCSPFASHR